MEPAPPPPTATYSSRLTRWFFRSSARDEDVAQFGVPAHFDDLQHQKGIKSNSWFHNDAQQQHKKSVRRVASTPNAKNMLETKQTPPPLPSGYDKSSPLSSTTTLATARLARSNQYRSECFNSHRRSYAANSVKVREVQVGPSRCGLHLFFFY